MIMEFNSILLENITGYDKHYCTIHDVFDELLYPTIKELCQLKGEDEYVYISAKHKEHHFEYKVGLINMDTEHKRKRRRIIIKLERDDNNNEECEY